MKSKVTRSGLIRFSRDPQQLYNFWRSAAAEAIALAPRAPFLATPAMIAKFKGQWDSQNTVSRPYLLYEPDPDAPGGRPMREPPPDIPAALVQESSIASDEMKATTGIYDAALGARSNEISGVAIRARESQGGVSALHYQDNLMATLNHLGKVLIDLVPKIYDSERTVRILHEDESHEPVRINVPVMGVDGKPMLLNDLSQGTYDVRVKIGPSYATRRSEAAEACCSSSRRFRKPPQLRAISGAQYGLARRGRNRGAAPAHAAAAGDWGSAASRRADRAGAAAGLSACSFAGAFKQGAGPRGEVGSRRRESPRGGAGRCFARSFECRRNPSWTPLAPEDQLKTALQEADLRERQASAAKAEADLQSKVFDNEVKRARFTEPSPYKL